MVLVAITEQGDAKIKVELTSNMVFGLPEILRDLATRIEQGEEGSRPKAGRMSEHVPGDVFQINEKHGRAGWIGCFVLATEIKPWGIQGFVSHVEAHDKQARAYIRLNWEHIDYVGRAPLIPQDEADT